MGSDMCGTIECLPRGAAAWTAAIDVDLLYAGRSYSDFGCLFGWRNRDGFTRPVAAGRGFPDGCSTTTRALLDECAGITWIAWSEVAAIDWDVRDGTAEPAEYRLTAGGETRRPVPDLRRFAELTGVAHEPRRGVPPPWPEGTTWRDDDHVFRIERPRRADVVSPMLEPVWAVMATLAGLHGADRVRLVVGFD